MRLRHALPVNALVGEPVLLLFTQDEAERQAVATGRLCLAAVLLLTCSVPLVFFPCAFALLPSSIPECLALNLPSNTLSAADPFVSKSRTYQRNTRKPRYTSFASAELWTYKFSSTSRCRTNPTLFLSFKLWPLVDASS